jgi:hypothetical protein
MCRGSFLKLALLLAMNTPVTASVARQSMHLEVMDCFTAFAMTESVHGKERSDVAIRVR